VEVEELDRLQKLREEIVTLGKVLAGEEVVALYWRGRTRGIVVVRTKIGRGCIRFLKKRTLGYPFREFVYVL